MTQIQENSIRFILIAAFMTGAIACSNDSNNGGTDNDLPRDTESAPTDTTCSDTDCSTDTVAEKRARYVFYLIGDGMGTAQVEAAQRYSISKHGKPLVMTGLASQGLTVTSSDSSVFTDSAAAATALACGQKTELGVLAMNPDGTQPYVSIAELARDAGLRVGVISNVPLDQATPGAFYAKAPSRKMRYEIAQQLPTSGFDFFGGGGFSVSDFPGEDMAEREQLYDDLKADIVKAGYVLAEGRTRIDALPAGDAKVVAINGVLDSYYAMPYAIDRADPPDAEDMTLVEIVDVAISRLSQTEDGFFLMVEGGRIDWAGHDHDSPSLVFDMLDFDAVVERALAFYEQHPDDTLIVVTADHECGGLVNSEPADEAPAFHEVIALQRMSRRTFSTQLGDLSQTLTGCDEVAAQIEFMYQLDMNEDGIGLPLSETERAQIDAACLSWQENLFTRYGHGSLTSLCSAAVNRVIGLEWTNSGHTPADVPVYAEGVGAELFAGTRDNTDVFHLIKQIMGL